jgi:hypothetical protein
MAKSAYKDKDKPAVPRARNDAYVMMLLITFFAIAIGCVMMYLDNKEYGGNAPPAPPKIGELDAGGSAPPKG